MGTREDQTSSARFDDSSWLDYDWAAVTYTAHVEDRRIQYVDVGAGRPLVLIHGQGGCWEWWLRVIPMLARDYRVIALDLAGYGSSDLPEGDAFTAQMHTVTSLLDHLGLIEASLVGHSMGGVIAAAVASAHPERVRDLVLVNGGPIPIGGPALGALLVGMRAAHVLLSVGIVNRWLGDNWLARRAFFAAMVDSHHSVPRELAVRLLPGIAAHGFVPTMESAVRALPEIDARDIGRPCLLIWGDNDRILPLRLGRKLADQITGSRTVVFERVGHCPMVEEPVRFVAEVSGFLRRATPWESITPKGI